MSQIEKEIQRHIKNISKTDKSISLTLCLPKSFIGFAGHFEDYPVLPGVVQICIGKIAAALLTGKTLIMIKMPVAKFKKQIAPEDEIKINTEITKYQDDLISLSTKIYLANEIASTFKTTYEVSY
ncbi:MAG: hypothetical protein OCC45_15890 [Desulfotalea sp.]